MINKKPAYFMVEVIISTLIISLAMGALFRVKDNTSLLMGKINNSNINTSLVLSLIPYTEKDENTNKHLLTSYKINTIDMKERFSDFSAFNNKIQQDLIKNSMVSNISISSFQITIENKNYKNHFYTFSFE